MSLQKLEYAEIMEKSGTLNGLFDVSEKDYHQLKFVSSSTLKKFLLSPKEAEPYLAPDVEAPEAEYTPALLFGSAFHTLVLEPDMFDERYIIEPHLDGPKNQNPWAAEWKAFKKTAVGRKIILRKDWLKMDKMRNGLHDNFFYQKFKVGMLPEKTLFWVDAHTGLQCKSRMDAFDETKGIMDVKTMAKIPTIHNCIRAITEYDYALQQVHYLSGVHHVFPLTPLNFTFLFVSKDGAHDNTNIKINAGDFVLWSAVYTQQLQGIKGCMAENYYPGVSKEVHEIELPAWASQKFLGV